MYFRHPDDETLPRFGTWSDDFATFDDACRFYGCDTPADLAAEARYLDEESWIEHQDILEALGGPRFVAPLIDDEIPF